MCNFLTFRVESQMLLESVKFSKLLLLLRKRQMVLFRTRQGGPGRRGSLDLIHRSSPKLCAKGHCNTPALESTSTPFSDLHSPVMPSRACVFTVEDLRMQPGC